MEDSGGFNLELASSKLKGRNIRACKGPMGDIGPFSSGGDISMYLW